VARPGGDRQSRPRRLRDIGYNAIARSRYRLFARPKEACPMLPPDLRSRFTAH
jgi:predicted DCC family thiol-disulfide oxidoreductase YuxK